MKKYIYIIAVIITSVIHTGCDDNDSHPPKGEYTTSVLIRGAVFNTASSVHFGPDGQMYAVDVAAKKILKMNPENGQILETLTEGIDGPADIDFAPDGTMYWPNSFLRQVYKRTPDGTVSLIADLETVTDGIAVNAEGRVFTASFEVGGRNALWEVDPYGEQPPRLVAELGGLDAYDFGPDGYLYAPDFLNGSGQVFQIDIDTGDFEVVADGFCQPIAVKFSNAGELYVLDYLCPQLFKVDIATGEKTLVANVDTAPDNFDFSPTDEIFMAFLGDAYIGKILPDGTIQEVTPRGLGAPGSISVRPDNSLFVATPFAIRLYDAETGVFQRSFGTDTGMIPPYTLYDDGQYFILSCHLFHTVQIWDPIEDKAIETQAVQQPLNAIRFGENVIVAEMETGTVFQLNDRTLLIEGLSVPTGLAAQKDDLYVADRETGIIWKAVESGVRLNPPQKVKENLFAPEGMAFDNDGHLLVVETGTGHLLRIDLESNNSAVIADNLEIGQEAPGGIAPTGFALSDVAVNESGDIYVTGKAGNIVYKIEKKRR